MWFLRGTWAILTLKSGKWTDAPSTMSSPTRSCFSTLKKMILGELGHGKLNLIRGKGKSKYHFEDKLWKQLTLKNVLYVSIIRKNLLSRSLLNKHSFPLVFELENVYSLRMIIMWVKDMNVCG